MQVQKRFHLVAFSTPRRLSSLLLAFSYRPVAGPSVHVKDKHSSARAIGEVFVHEVEACEDFSSWWMGGGVMGNCLYWGRIFFVSSRFLLVDVFFQYVLILCSLNLLVDIDTRLVRSTQDTYHFVRDTPSPTLMPSFWVACM